MVLWKAFLNSYKIKRTNLLKLRMFTKVLWKIKIMFLWVNHPLIGMLLEDLILIWEVIRDGPQGVFNSPRST